MGRLVEAIVRVALALNRIATAMEDANVIEKGRIEYMRIEQAEAIAQQHELMSQIRQQNLDGNKRYGDLLGEVEKLRPSEPVSAQPAFQPPKPKTAKDSPFAKEMGRGGECAREGCCDKAATTGDVDFCAFHQP